MSEVKVNKISPRTACGTVTLGDSGDTFTIPAGATITNSGTASGFGATGETSWDTTVKTTGTFTATAGVGYFLNTTGGIITVNLPAGAAGSSVALSDYAGTWQTNNVTVSPNGAEKMGGVNADITLSTQGQAVTFVYIDGTQGWVNVLDSTSNVRGNAYIIATGGTITCCGDYKIHTFTGPGTFTVTAGGAPTGSNSVEYLVVAGGAGGGGDDIGAGGGAGGFRFASPSIAPLTYPAKPLAAPANLPVSVQGYPIAVGGGGTNGSPSCRHGGTGVNSSFSSITSAGGGGGGRGNNDPAPNPRSGGNGGSGGGAGFYPATATSGGIGNTPPVSPSQGNNGGDSPSPQVTGGGGGGATAVGATGTSGSTGANGGAGGGLPTAFGSNGVPCGSYRYYAGGGAGSGDCAPFGTGGLGGGGAGGPSGPATPGTGVSGTTNSGGGGGGAGGKGATGGDAGSGGSGIVVIRYKYQ